MANFSWDTFYKAIKYKSHDKFTELLQEAIQTGIDFSCLENDALIRVQDLGWDIQLLLKIPGICVNVVDELRMTPLTTAIQHGNYTDVRLLLEAKADPNYRRADVDFTPLALAVRVTNHSIARLLLRHNADIFAKIDNENILASCALRTPSWRSAAEYVAKLSKWDTGTCVVEQGELILCVLASRRVTAGQFCRDYFNEIDRVLHNTISLITDMKEKTITKLHKFLERAVRVKDLAHSILRYF
jgi:hypothetical protein